MTSHAPELEGLFRRWVRATSLGWLLGLLILIILALLGDLLGSFAPSNVQFMVGLGIGCGVGYVQGRALSPWLGQPIHWTVATTIGMGALFVVHDVVVASGSGFPYSLPLYVIAGSLVAGIWQSFLLRHVSARANHWVAASLIAWTLPALGIALGDSEATGFVGDIASLAAIFFGGVMLGAVSGPVLVRLLGHRPAAAVLARVC